MRDKGPTVAERVAEYIREHGPQTQADIARGLKCPINSVCTAVKHAGFGRRMSGTRLLITVVGEVVRVKPGRKTFPPPKPRKKPARNSNTGRRGGFPDNLEVQDADGVRRRIARYLAEHGPVHGDVAADALGMTLELWWLAVGNCRWFTFEEPGPTGWRLTDRGRAEALAEPTQEAA